MTILAANIDQNPASVTNLETLLNDHITTVTIHHKPATYQPLYRTGYCLLILTIGYKRLILTINYTLFSLY